MYPMSLPAIAKHSSSLQKIIFAGWGCVGMGSITTTNIREDKGWKNHRNKEKTIANVIIAISLF
jgi:hypothetical protein